MHFLKGRYDNDYVMQLTEMLVNAMVAIMLQYKWITSTWLAPELTKDSVNSISMKEVGRKQSAFPHAPRPNTISASSPPATSPLDGTCVTVGEAAWRYPHHAESLFT